MSIAGGLAWKAAEADYGSLGQRPKSVDLTEIVDQHEPRTRPLYIHFGLERKVKRFMRLGIGHDLTRIVLNPKYPRKLASEKELLALRPELVQTE